MKQGIDGIRIISLEAIPIELPFKEKIADVWGTYTSSRHGIVRVKAENGVTGIGEISFAWLGGAHPFCSDVTTLWAPRLIGQEITQITQMTNIMDSFCSFSKRHLLAKAGVEMALWDLLGKSLGVSVAVLLGGRLRSAIPLTGGIPMGTRDEMVQIAKKRVRQGYTSLKLKIGFDAKEDLAAVRAVRAAVGDDVALRADANMAWHDRNHALWMLGELWETGVSIIEQPIAMGRLDDMRWLRDRADIRIMLDEDVWDIQDAKRCLDAGAADMLNIYTCEAGGIQAAARIAQLASLYHIPCIIGSMPEGQVGAAASAQLAACIENLANDASDIRGFTAYSDDLVTAELRIEDGSLIVPDGPGLGIELDEEKLAYYRVG